MIARSLLIATMAVSFVAATAVTADARAKRHLRHAKIHRAHVYPVNSSALYSGPARMIEVRPGFYISSYGCVTRETNGSIIPCGAHDSIGPGRN